MSYLADTNVLSESAKRIPSLKVLEWLRANGDRIYVSSVSLGELAYGIELLPHFIGNQGFTSGIARIDDPRLRFRHMRDFIHFWRIG